MTKRFTPLGEALSVRSGQHYEERLTPNLAGRRITLRYRGEDGLSSRADGLILAAKFSRPAGVNPQRTAWLIKVSIAELNGGDFSHIAYKFTLSSGDEVLAVATEIVAVVGENSRSLNLEECVVEAD